MQRTNTLELLDSDAGSPRDIQASLQDLCRMNRWFGGVATTYSMVERVVAATNLWSWTFPTHILYSPEGQTLYRSTGYLSADQINDLSRYMQDWDEWSRNGRRQWMKAVK